MNGVPSNAVLPVPVVPTQRHLSSDGFAGLVLGAAEDQSCLELHRGPMSSGTNRLLRNPTLRSASTLWRIVLTHFGIEDQVPVDGLLGNPEGVADLFPRQQQRPSIS